MRFSSFSRILFFTGAGLSAESGIPTYRGKGGVWRDYDWEEYACRRAFEKDPGKVWDFHDERRKRVAAALPNGGHLVIAEVQRRIPGTAVVTQNVDGLHQRAGAKGVIELHGSLWRTRCDRDGTRTESFDAPIASRRCATCGGWLRPDIVWFGDVLDPAVVGRAREAISSCDLFVAVGTSGEVQPAAEMPLLAREAGARLVEVNVEETRMTPLYDESLRGKASEVLKAMLG